MEVTYRRSLHKSYMCIKEQGTVQEAYELQMLERQTIPRLLPVQISVVEGERSYLYNISGRQQIEDYLSGKKMDYAILQRLLFAIQELCVCLPEYLLREDGVCLKWELIYVNLEDGSLYFTYLPFQKKSLSEAFEHCMEQILRKIDHQDKAATELAYQIYQMCTQENANIREMLETALEHAAVQSAEEEALAGRESAPGIEGTEYKQGNQKEYPESREEFQETERKKEQQSEGIRERLGKWFSQGAILNNLPIQRPAAGESAANSFPVKTPPMEESPGFQKKGFSDFFALFKTRGEKEACTDIKIIKKEPFIKKETKKETALSAKCSKKKYFRKKDSGQSSMEAAAVQEPELISAFSAEGDALVRPTEILGIRRQEPIGKLVYQGVHGCGDIFIEGETFLLGKNRQQADGVIDAEGVSRLHARIIRQGTIYYIEDLNSTNGTYLNEEPLEYHQKRELNRNDRIRFGREEYMFS